MCGRKGCGFVAPAVDHQGVEAFLAGRELQMEGERGTGESYATRDARVRAEYLARFPSEDALAEFRGGPPGPASMCGKFTAMASWGEVVSFSQPLTRDDMKASDNDREVTLRVMSNVPIIIWDKEEGMRRVVPMRWGFPDPKNWKVPKPIHARSEIIETTKAFASGFLDGQRGIVLMKTFNEAPDIEGPTIQHSITPGDEPALAAAFVWRRFQIPELASPLLACVLVTVPANKLIATL